MKIITKTRGRFKYQVQEQSTGYVYRSFPSEAEAQKYITHTDGVIEAAAPYVGSLDEELDNEAFLDGGR